MGVALAQVIAGLKNHLAADQLLGRSVCLIVNLKPAKLAGKVSEAMILAAVASQPDGSELVHPIQPPGQDASPKLCKPHAAIAVMQLLTLLRDAFCTACVHAGFRPMPDSNE